MNHPARMASLQAAYDSRTDPRLECDDEQAVFAGSFGERYLDCCECDHAWVLYAHLPMPECCPECGGEFLDLTATAKREGWLRP